jgi:predicted DsbA family dithiol-disulfide isomerase
VARELGDRATFSRRTFLLLPGVGERPVYDDYVIAHRRAAAAQAPELGFAIPRRGQPYPRSSLPAQLLAQRVRAVAPARLEALEDALLRAVFVDLADVADREVLRGCAREASVDADEVDRALDDPALVAQAVREHEAALACGIDGIPALLVPGHTSISGAVPVETYREALARALADRSDG